MAGVISSEAVEWLALRRVHEGAVTKLAGCYLADGRLVAEFLAAAVEGLIAEGLLALGRPDSVGCQQVCVTHAGQVRYAALSGGGVSARHGGADET